MARGRDVCYFYTRAGSAPHTYFDNFRCFFYFARIYCYNSVSVHVSDPFDLILLDVYTRTGLEL